MVDLSSSFFCKRLKQRLAPEAAGRASGEGLRDARPWALRGEGLGFGTRIPEIRKDAEIFWEIWLTFFGDNLQTSMK